MNQVVDHLLDCSSRRNLRHLTREEYQAILGREKYYRVAKVCMGATTEFREVWMKCCYLVDAEVPVEFMPRLNSGRARLVIKLAEAAIRFLLFTFEFGKFHVSSTTR